MRDDEREPRRAQLLYLEDEVLIAFDIAAFLEELDVGDVTTAHKLKSAWMAIENKRFDLALLDINVDRRQTSFEIGSQACAATGITSSTSRSITPNWKD